MGEYRRLEDLVVYQKLCRLHIDHREFIRMLGMERTLETKLPESDRCWPNSSINEEGASYDVNPPGFAEL